MQVEQDGRPAGRHRGEGDRTEGSRNRASTVLVLLLATGLLATWWWLDAGRPMPTWLTGPPPGFEVPQDGAVVADRLEDGTPVFLSHLDGEVTVLDARLPGPGPDADGRLRRLVGYCPSSGGFEEPAHGSMFGRDGRWNGGPAPGSLAIHPHEAIDGRIVAAQGAVERERPGRSTTTTRPPPTGPNCVDDQTIGTERTLLLHHPDDPGSLADVEEGTWRWVDLSFEPTDATGDGAGGDVAADEASGSEHHLHACDDQGCAGSFHLPAPWTPPSGPALVRGDDAADLEVLLPADPTPAG